MQPRWVVAKVDLQAARGASAFSKVDLLAARADLLVALEDSAFSKVDLLVQVASTRAMNSRLFYHEGANSQGNIIAL